MNCTYRSIIFSLTITICLIAVNAPQICAQEKVNYKIGDRVEADPLTLERWSKGTIIKLYLQQDKIYAADVRMDKEKDYTGAQKITTVGTKHLRLLSETAAEKNIQEIKQQEIQKNTAKLRVDENNTVLADREIINCRIEQKKYKNGDRPDPKLIGRLIQCLWEKPAREGMDGAVTMEHTPLKIGAPRKWIPLKDIGTGGNVNTLVYPVKADYIVKTFYRTNIAVREYEGMFNCYVNSFGDWICGTASGNKQVGITKNIPVQ